MNMKTVLVTLAAFAMGGAANAITSEEIASVLGVDPSIATFSLEGDSEWFVDTNVFHSGDCSMRSGQISGYSNYYRTSDMVMNLTVKEPCVLSYWLRRSMASNTSYFLLVESIDNITYTNTGSVDWFYAAHVLTPGDHTIRFSYQRQYDWTPSGYEHCCWFDDFSIEPIMPAASKVEVTNIKCQQRYPWNGMVDIDYTVRSEDPNAEVWVYPIGYDNDSNTSMAPRSLTGDGVDAPVSNGTFRMTWKVTDDYPEFHSTAFTVKMIALTGSAPYMVVDLSGGVDAISYPVSYLSSVPEGGWGDEYKTTKLVLRLIPPGSFMMGSPSDENGRSSYEDLHGVVLTKPFYIGVFEVTQKQYELVMGATPVAANWWVLVGDMRPVSYVSYNDIRGSINGAGWPTHNQVDANSFMGRLRSKVNMLFDLPTEAQWEYACRAGTSTALNSGKSYDGGDNCNEIARWSNNRSDGKGGYDDRYTSVGSYLANAWGLYDMHGNVRELCKDCFNWTGLGYATVVDPRGVTSGARAVRGGDCGSGSGIRSAFRDAYMYAGDVGWATGFRVMCSPVAE